MATVHAAPIKVDPETDQLISTAAHFLDKSKKSVVAEAVRAYVDENREAIQEAVMHTMRQLDGSNTSVVSALTGMSKERLDALGGVPED